MLLFRSRQFQYLARLRRTHPLLRHWTIVTSLVVIFWIYIIHYGERETFSKHVQACDWKSWESWPAEAQPHRAVLIADPQLVDPHTYPGRPWPLSTLTEKYTDRYMARSFKLINQELDPDSVVFLGDMFDGGREWNIAEPKPLTPHLRWRMEGLSPNTKDAKRDLRSLNIPDPNWSRDGLMKRNIEVSEEERIEAAPDFVDYEKLLRFVHGEDGRWQKYGNQLWEEEYNRFGKIFLSPSQLYPDSDRDAVVYTRQQHQSNLENGAKFKTKYESVTFGGKTKTVIASLPGNHDLGYGSGVQLPVRARYKWHFGDTSRVDVLGNHTFVSVDSPSLAAWSQFESDGQETRKAVSERKHIYAAAQYFLDGVSDTASRAVDRELQYMFPEQSRPPMWRAGVVDTSENVTLGNARAYDKPASLPVVLLSHVPLYRAPDTDCGPLRERGHALLIAGGYQYQNVLTGGLTKSVLQRVSQAGPITHAFSGDDHDYCNVTHSVELQNGKLDLPEETVKSFSWAMGVRRPGFTLVSMWNPIDGNGKSLHPATSTMQTHLCLLPDQLGIFINYVFYAAMTGLILALRAIIVAARSPINPEEDELDEENEDEARPMLDLHALIPDRFRKSKVYDKLSKMPAKSRHRASSSGLKPPASMHLSVQRSANARARSVSPGAGLLGNGTASYQSQHGYTDQAGYLAARYDRSAEVSEDEDRIESMDYLGGEDSQAKWRIKQKPKGRLRRAWDEFVATLLLVVSVAGCYYIITIRTG